MIIRRNKRLKHAKRLVCLTLVVWPSLGWTADWFDGRHSSCIQVCKTHGEAVTSGTYKNGNAYAVCRTNLNGEGLRPGYNLEPSWANACFVGWGGREVSGPDFDCLCKS